MWNSDLGQSMLSEDKASNPYTIFSIVPQEAASIAEP